MRLLASQQTAAAPNDFSCAAEESISVSFSADEKNLSVQPPGHSSRAEDSHVSSESVKVVVGLLALDDAVVLQWVELAILRGGKHKQRVNRQVDSKMVHLFRG